MVQALLLEELVRAKKRIPSAGARNEKRVICKPSTVDEMLASTPPGEIGDGNLLPHMEKEQQKVRRTFNYGSLPAKILRGRFSRPEDRVPPIAPDKRARPAPEPARIPPRKGGPVMF